MAVFDIDGVLADVSHRLHYLQSYPQRWDRFFGAATATRCWPRARPAAGGAVDHDVVYLTGRRSAAGG